MKISIILVTSVLFIILFSGCAEIPTNSPTSTPIITPADEILLSVFVIIDKPDDTMVYELFDKNPTQVGVYKFYLINPNIPGSGTFKKMDEISLERINESTFYGKKRITKINGTMCTGYPPINWIDGIASVEINQTEEEVAVTVHYWKTKIGIIGAS